MFAEYKHISKKQRTKDIELEENVSFEDLKLSKKILDGLKAAGFYKPSPVQLKAIPLGKIGLDLIVQAKSGTGKTCVFSVVCLEHVLLSNSKALQALILVHTREVALQICDVINLIGKFCNINAKSFIGGKSLKEDRANLKNCQIAIGTPGRILHLINEKLIVTGNIRLFILDEADKLLAPEFQENINLIFSKLPQNKQIITLSATYPSYMSIYVARYMRNATFVRLNAVDPSLRGIKQYFKITPYSEIPNLSFDYKVECLLKIFNQIQFQQCIIFTNYQTKAENLSKTLNARGLPSIFISGNLSQTERNKAIANLKEFKSRILVSTDLTSRGIDIDSIDLVISMDLPADPETYLHRIGRAGRYGSEGIALSFVCEKEEENQFEKIIDSYDLMVTQFNENLQDIIVVKNPKSIGTRIDDVTIKSIGLTKSELDKSLLEYELSKNELSKRPIRSNVNTLFEYKLNPNLKIIKYKDLKNELLLNCANSDNKLSNLDCIQNKFISVRNLESVKLNYDSWIGFELGKENTKLKPVKKTLKSDFKIAKTKTTIETTQTTKVQVLEHSDYSSMYPLYFKHYYSLNE